jgi:hypothetical protein
MNDTRNRDKPASAMTKREEAALRIYAFGRLMTGREAVTQADALFDALEDMPELAHPYDEPDFGHEGHP